MQYSLLIYQTGDHFAARTDPARRDANNAAFGRFVGALHAAGVLVTTLGIEPPDACATVTPADTHKGPHTNAKEQLGGVCVIEAPDLDAALEWARQMPFECCGAVEVRPTRVVTL